MNQIAEVSQLRLILDKEGGVMTPERRAEMCRAIVKKKMRDEGLRFDKNQTQRDFGRIVRELNEQIKPSEPFTIAEYSEVHVEITEELVAEHFDAIKKHNTPPKQVGVKPRSTVQSGVPGQAFYHEHSGQSGMSADVTE